MKQLSNLAKIMFCIVAVLLVITVVLGIMTAVKDSKANKDKNHGNTTTITTIPNSDEKAGTETITPEPTETPVPTETPAPSGGHTVVLDPGQQKNAMTEDEPIGPGATATTDKMSYGATSATTGKREYEWSLPFTKKIQKELENRGYKVLLTREDADVMLSNGERAQFANENKADIYLSIQADAASNKDAKGIYAQIPSQSNAYTKDLYADCKQLAKAIQNALIAETGAKDRGVQENDNVAAINYSKNPVAVLQLGFMSNTEEDTNLWSEDYQNKMVKAICDGIDTYFQNHE